MLKICKKFSELDFDKLAQVYGYDKTTQYDDLYDYLHEDFYRVNGAFYAIWEVEGMYISVLRAEPYKEGYLIEALQTRKLFQRMGYARKLLDAVLNSDVFPAGIPIYAHIHKSNTASLNLHYSCGFSMYLDHAAFIDGSVSRNSCTVKWLKQPPN